MVKNQRVRSHTNVLDPCGVRVWGELPGLSRTPGLQYWRSGPRLGGLGVGANCCITTELIYLWPAD